MAAATFLIVALSAFHLDPRGQTPALHSGNGGFALAAESDQPILANLNSPEARKDLGFSAEDERLLAGSTIVSLRVRAGEDASCLNLYRPRQPRVLGVGSALVDRDGFAWADAPPEVVNPWQLLDQSPAPVILEKNTANYSLNLWGGLGQALEIADGRGRPLRLRVAALLADSIFQGDLLVSEREFLKRFPDTSGYRFFLVDSPPGKTAAVRNLLERNLGDYGFTAETTAERLADFLAVQNTYLSTFQSLGGLGLLLGTLGLAAVELRSVFERRSELALSRAVGFRRRRLASFVCWSMPCCSWPAWASACWQHCWQCCRDSPPAPRPCRGRRSAARCWPSWRSGLAAGGLAVRAVLRARCSSPCGRKISSGRETARILAQPPRLCRTARGRSRGRLPHILPLHDLRWCPCGGRGGGYNYQFRQIKLAPTSNEPNWPRRRMSDSGSVRPSTEATEFSEQRKRRRRTPCWSSVANEESAS